MDRVIQRSFHILSRTVRMNLIRPQDICPIRQTAASLLCAPTPNIRASTLSRQFRPLRQQARNKAEYTMQRNSAACPRSLLDAGRLSSQRDTPRFAHRPSPFYQNPQLGARASFSTEAVTVAGERDLIIHHEFESKTGTWQYVVADPSTLAAAIIDPVLNYDPATQRITTDTADSLLSLIRQRGYRVDMILETHSHADHLTAASYLQSRLSREQNGHRPSIGIGKRIGQVQEIFRRRYGISAEDCHEDVFDNRFEDDEVFHIGNVKVVAIHLPGHTPDHLGYMIGDNVFCGDSIFHADIGTARCDFPGGSATNLFASGRKLLNLPDHVRIWTGHDYPPDGRSAPIAWMSVKKHKRQNKHLKDGITEEDFVAVRKERDSKLSEPKLLHPSLQINIRAGRLPEKLMGSGLRLLHLPIKMEGQGW